MTPYFVPPRELLGSLKAAALRGVDVVVILPAHNNLPYIHRATRHMLWEPLQYHVQIYYQPPPFVHSKLMIVDEHYALIGSANMDARSLRLNFELNVEVYDQQFADRLGRYFQGVRARSRPVTLEDVDGRTAADSRSRRRRLAVLAVFVTHRICTVTPAGGIFQPVGSFRPSARNEVVCMPSLRWPALRRMGRRGRRLCARGNDVGSSRLRRRYEPVGTRRRVRRSTFCRRRLGGDAGRGRSLSRCHGLSSSVRSRARDAGRGSATAAPSSGSRFARGSLSHGDETLTSGEFSDTYAFVGTRGGQAVIDLRSRRVRSLLARPRAGRCAVRQ